MQKVVQLLYQYDQYLMCEHFQFSRRIFSNNELSDIEMYLKKIQLKKRKSNVNCEKQIQEPNKIELNSSIYEYTPDQPENGSLFVNLYEKEQAQKELTDIGYQLIQENKVAVVLLAGGLGSRMDLDEPKGSLQITPLLKKSLFQFFVEQIQFLESHASILKHHVNSTKHTKKDSSIETSASVDNENGMEKKNSTAEEKDRTTIYLYLMTSDKTHDKTVAYFEANNYWGMKKENVRFFKQANFPATDFHYNFLLEDDSEFLLIPVGNGDLFRAMDEHKIMEDMEEKGIKYIQVVAVDNILTKIADPSLLGFCSFFNCDIANKCVKRNQGESMGVFCVAETQTDGSNQQTQAQHCNPFSVCEYMELPTSILQNPDFCKYGNICHHVFSYDFVSSVIKNKWYNQMELHKIKKKREHYDVYLQGKKKPTNTENAYSYEYFLCDIFKFAKRILSFEVAREKEFQPIKTNFKGNCILDAQQRLSDLHKSWLLKKDYKFVNDIHTDEIHKDHSNNNVTKNDFCEISPLVSYDGTYFTNLPKQTNLTLPFVLDKEKP